MKYLIFQILTFLLFNVTLSFSQDILVLQHLKKSGKEKILKLDREYIIKTNDTTYYSQIVEFTDSTLSITKWEKTGKDTSYAHTYTHMGKERLSTTVRPLYAIDTMEILFTDIQYLKKDWFENKRWIEPFGWIAIGSAMVLVAVPVIWGFEGKEKAVNGLEFAGFLAAVSLPVIFIGTRKTKYDLKKKWTLKMTKATPR